MDMLRVQLMKNKRSSFLCDVPRMTEEGYIRYAMSQL